MSEMKKVMANKYTLSAPPIINFFKTSETERCELWGKKTHHISYFYLCCTNIFMSTWVKTIRHIT